MFERETDRVNARFRYWFPEQCSLVREELSFLCEEGILCEQRKRMCLLKGLNRLLLVPGVEPWYWDHGPNTDQQE
jgi:hypothetical protein